MIQTAPFVPVLFGNGSSKALGEKAKAMQVTKMLVVCDPGIVKTGIISNILDILHREGIETIVFDKVLPDPPDTIINEAGQLAAREGVDGILGVGGGSSLDSAKAVNVLIHNPGTIDRYYGPCAPAGDPCPLILVPTTAGTGSECTSVSVVTDSVTHRKMGIVSPRHTLARLAVVDPELYVGMPLIPTAYCAMDALTHAVDTLCRPDPQPFACLYAREAIELIAGNLPLVMENSRDLDARGALALAATLGGCAINGGGKTHLSHAIGHVLGSELHIPHGLACIVALPQLVERYYGAWTPGQMKTVASCMGIDQSGAAADLGGLVAAYLRRLMGLSHIPSLRQLGFSLEQVLACVPLIPRDVTFSCAPHPLSADELTDLLTGCYGEIWEESGNQC